MLVGVTDWCTEPADLDAVRVGGTKNPSVPVVLGLRPDLVLANEEENRPSDLEALRSGGIDVDVTHVRTVAQGLAELRRVLGRLGVAPDWLDEADAVWSEPWTGPRRTALVPIWRRPWMAVGADTFAGDVLSHLGVENVLGASPERYPRFALDQVPTVDLVVLPDEPYAFSPTDGPEAFSAPAVLVSGRDLTWYGPSLVRARGRLAERLGVPGG